MDYIKAAEVIEQSDPSMNLYRVLVTGILSYEHKRSIYQNAIERNDPRLTQIRLNLDGSYVSLLGDIRHINETLRDSATNRESTLIPEEGEGLVKLVYSVILAVAEKRLRKEEPKPMLEDNPSQLQ